MDEVIPPELLLPAPRTLRRRKDYGGMGRVARFFVTLFALVPIGFLIFSIVEPILLSRAALIDATITDLHTTRGGKGGTHYHVGYQFGTVGMMQEDRQDVGATIYHQLQLNQRVMIRRIQIGSWSTTELDLVWQHYVAERWTMWLVGSFSALIFLILIAQARQRELLRSGTPTIGRIVGKSITRGKSSSYWLTFEFPDESGQTIRKRATVFRQFYDSIQEGDAVCVLYDPHRPRRAMIYGTTGYECAGSRDYGS